jgi:antirestriction protein
MTSTQPRIYIASLTDYNNGILHGAWLDVSDEDSMREDIEAMLAQSPMAKRTGQPAEEWRIDDFEGFGTLRLGEYEPLDTIVRLAEGLEEHGQPFLAWAACRPEALEDFEDNYRGEWKSLADYVQDFWEQCGGLPEAPANAWWHPANYTDWERMAHDLQVSGDVFTVDSRDGQVFVFDNH